MAMADMRRDYRLGALTEQRAGDDPHELFNGWFSQAQEQSSEANAFVLATVDGQGRPHARVVLCKGFDAVGFRFFTNLHSAKAQDLTRHPFAAMCFHWPEFERQVRIEGPVDLVSREEVAAYFHSRPRTSQLGAWASQQSAVIANRDELEDAFGSVAAVHAKGAVPVPPHWGGYCIHPQVMEFWQGRSSRLHDRLRYWRDQSGEWRRERLAP